MKGEINPVTGSLLISYAYGTSFLTTEFLQELDVTACEATDQLRWTQ